MDTVFRTSEARAILPRLRVIPPTAERLFEGGDYDSGDGLTVTMMPEFLLIQLRLFERDAELWIPVDHVLNAIGRQQHMTGS